MELRTGGRLTVAGHLTLGYMYIYVCMIYIYVYIYIHIIHIYIYAENVKLTNGTLIALNT